MCLELKKGYRRKVANKDITCYKIGYIRGKEFTPFFKTFFRYTPNAIANSRIDIIKHRHVNKFDDIIAYIETGLHSFTNKNYILQRYYERITDYSTYSDLILGVFIIPKSSNYYRGIYRDYDESEIPSYASNQLIWTGKYYRNIGGKISLING